jgi:hypothetical protein
MSSMAKNIVRSIAFRLSRDACLSRLAWCLFTIVKNAVRYAMTDSQTILTRNTRLTERPSELNRQMSAIVLSARMRFGNA